MKIRGSLFRLLRTHLVPHSLLGIATLLLSSCGAQYYKFPQYTFANRPIPPSQLANRVMVAVSNDSQDAAGGTGSLIILDGKRDIRSNVQNTIRSFQVNGFSGGYPSLILNFPEQVRGYVYADANSSLSLIDYGKETAAPSPSLPAGARYSSIAISPDFLGTYGARESTGQLILTDATQSYALNLPGVYRVAVNQGNSVILAMVRNSNTLYRIVRLNASQPNPPGYIDCQPINNPVYCVVPVSGTYDRPVGVYFSVDGSAAYVLNCGPECGGGVASVSVLQQAPLNYRAIPTVSPEPSPVTANIPVPGGVTTALANAGTLYVAGQQQLQDGLFTGRLSTINLASNTVTGSYGISDGYHSRLLFADDNSLWIGSQDCGSGERAKLGTNYNCLTRFDLGGLTAQIIPSNVVPGSTAAGATVPFPNDNLNLYYYGSLTGLCWVQNLHKVYTAYGGQVHAFSTTDGTEINNSLITVQGTALDVAYMDALSNAAN